MFYVSLYIRGVARLKSKCRPKLGGSGGHAHHGKKCVPRTALVPFDAYLKDIPTHVILNLFMILKIMRRPGPSGLLGSYATDGLCSFKRFVYQTFKYVDKICNCDVFKLPNPDIYNCKTDCWPSLRPSWCVKFHCK